MFCKGTKGGWIKCGENPLVGGDLGTCFDISMLQDGETIIMYFSWRDCHSIARCTSTDGIHWSAPELCLKPRETAEGWENALNRASIVKAGSIYHMWYTGQYHAPVRNGGTSDIFHAVSEDGVRFTRTSDKPVLRAELPWEEKNVMCPSVLWDEGRQLFRMWYSAGEQYEPNAIGYAESRDGLVWEKSPLNPVFQADPASEWEQHKTTACQVFFHEGWYWMFYIGFENEDYAQIGVARSRDGVTGWERSQHNPIIAPDEGAWDGDACYKPVVLRVGDRWMLWYNGRKEHKEQIGMAYHEGELFDF